MTHTTTAGFGLTLFTALCFGCGVGGVGGGGDPGPGGGDPGPGGSDPDLPEDVICLATLTLSGSLERDPEAMGDGCVPNGVWTVNVSLDEDGCTDEGFPPEFHATYTYQVTGGVTGGEEESRYQVVWLEDPDNLNVDFRLKAKGGGECEGSFEHWSEDGQILVILHPHEENLAISGKGNFEVYE